MAENHVEQLNLKVKSQVTPLLLRTAKRSSSRSRAPLSSRNSWMPTANARAYLVQNLAQRQQRAIPFRRRATSREPDSQGTEHGERGRDRCCD